jgi:dihydrofolate reductase
VRPAAALIWAQTPAGVIGAAGGIPWSAPEDLARFKRLTWGEVVAMGRATWESLPRAWRPLPGRLNLVLSRTPGFAPGGAKVVDGPAAAFAAAAAAEAPGPLWVIGGGQVFRAFMPWAVVAEVTVVDLDTPGDTTAPLLAPPWELIRREPAVGWLTSANGTRYRFDSWVRRAPGAAAADA